MYVMGFDYGTKRIGVAVGQTLIATARPLAIVLVRNQQIDWVRISALLQDWQPEALVVGLPQYADGSDNAITIAARRFSQQLQERYQLPVYMIDERLSSVAAAESEKMKKRKAKEAIDAVAAQVILETWLSTESIK